MKLTRTITAIALMGLATFTSCSKKDYVCTCTTVVGAASTDIKHNINNAYYGDARKSCNNFQDEANSSLPGGTSCHL
jgi:hypothetical protein